MKANEIFNSFVSEDDFKADDFEKTYSKTKGEITKVVARLRGNESRSFTQAARHYERIQRHEEKLKAMRDKLNSEMKDRMAEIFTAEEAVLTRVMETASLTMTLSAQKPSSKVNHEKVLEDLLALAPELESKVAELVEKHTKVTTPAARLGKPKTKLVKDSVEPEHINEASLGEFWEKVKAFGKKVLANTMSWARSYDAKLDSIKQRAGL